MILKKIFQIKNSMQNRKFYKRIVIFGGLIDFKIRLKSYIKSGNEILIRKGDKLKPVKSIKGMTLVCKGRGNRVIIEEPFEFSDCFISLTGNNNFIEIKKSEHILFCFSAYADNDSKLTVGENFSCASMDISMKHSKEVRIGDDCMCSDNVLLLANDGHPLTDAQSGEILNYGGSIEIGNHVWLGRRSIVCKNSKIPDNSIVGVGAVVTKKFEEENIAVAGVPAKVVKQNINWKREF